MRCWCRWSVCLGLLALYYQCAGEVRVFIQETNASACLRYQCTAGETVRAFALNVSLDRGQIIGVSNFFRGLSTAAQQGYGIFPAAFRDYITVNGTNANWEAVDYTPVAVAADLPGDTLPGLNSSGVTLEFGGLWDPNVPAATPGPSGTLCVLEISEAANVTVSANLGRGGVVAATSDFIPVPVFAGAFVDPVPRILSATVENGVILIQFKGGQLWSASAPEGPWTGTGNTSGSYTEPVAGTPAKFFRVQRL